jgi:hypothetical protein
MFWFRGCPVSFVDSSDCYVVPEVVFPCEKEFPLVNIATIKGVVHTAHKDVSNITIKRMLSSGNAFILTCKSDAISYDIGIN